MTTGRSVASLFPPGTNIPPAAQPSNEPHTGRFSLYFELLVLSVVEGDISRDEGTFDFSFQPNTVVAIAATLVYDVATAVVDDNAVERNEGFILYVSYDESNNPRDTIVAGDRAILVTIIDNDSKNPTESTPSVESCCYCRSSGAI